MKTCPFKAIASILAVDIDRKSTLSKKELNEVAQGIELYERENCQLCTDGFGVTGDCFFVVIADMIVHKEQK